MVGAIGQFGKLNRNGDCITSIGKKACNLVALGMDILTLSFCFQRFQQFAIGLNRKFVAAAFVSPWLSSPKGAGNIALGAVAELLQYLAHHTSPTIKTPSVSAINVRD